MPRRAPHQVDVITVRKDPAITLLGGRGQRLRTAPRVNHDVFRRTWDENLVPANGGLSTFVDHFLHALAEIRLQFLIRLVTVRLLEVLNLGIGVPSFPVYLVSANVEIMIRKKFGHLPDKRVEKLVGFFIGWIHGRIQHAPLRVDFERPRGTGDFRITDKPGRAVSRHVEFRDNADSAITRVSDDIANLILLVVLTARAQGVQLRQFFAFGAESLIVRKMPVEDVQFHRFHPIEVALQHIEWSKVPAGINHQAAPRETRLVLNGYGGGGKTIGRDRDELQESLQAAEYAEGICGVEFRPGGRDFKRVGLVFARFLDI